MGQLVAFGGSHVLSRAAVSEGSLYGSPVHWPQPINSKSLHRSTGAGRGAVTCPRPSYYFNTLCLPLRSFYLSDFSRTHHLGPSRGQTGALRHEARGGVKWFIGNVCYWLLRRGSARMDSEQKCGGETVNDEPFEWELFMAWRCWADPRTAPGRFLKFSVTGFCSPLMATWPRQ